MAGEDLRKYLILPPPAQSSPSPSSTFAPPSDSQSRARSGVDTTAVPGRGRTAGTMELNHPAAPLHSADVGTGGLAVFSMDEYMAMHEPAIKAEQEQAAASKLPAQKNMSSSSLPGAVPVPVAVGARSSTHTILLNDKGQKLGIERPEFVYKGDSAGGWRVSTSFLGHEFGPVGPFSTKQQAKEALSEKVLEVLLEMEKEGKFEKGVNVHETAKEQVTNWSGQLLEFQRACDSPQPLYVDYNLGTQFSCLLTIEGLASHPEPFGSTSVHFTTKKAARQHAASCAVQHFKDQGLWPENIAAVGGIRKKKVVQPSTEPKAKNPTTGSTFSTDAASYPQQAAQLAADLGLNTPEWRLHLEDSSAPGFHTVSCFFKSGGPHQGPIGEVRHVFGKKKAKEECARLTVEYLQGVREKRMEYGARVMAGTQGGNGAGETAPQEGYKGEMGQDKKQGESVREQGQGAEGDSDVEFEDAVEF